MKAALWTVLGLVLVAGIVVGGYEGGWWLKTNNTNRQRQLDQKNYGTQLAYIQKIDNSIAEISQPGVTEQEKAAVTQQICTYASLLTSAPDNIAAFVSQNCL